MRNQRIVCPVDFSDCSAEALGVAGDLARQSEATLILVNVYSAPSLASSEAALVLPDILERLTADSENALAKWCADARARGVKAVETHALCGVAWNEIVRLAVAREADLIVMGTHGRSGLKHVVLGSVAEKVVRHAPCSVLIVRAPDAKRR
jgi:universal stress protein A